jgi:WD40 repeat protein
MRKIEGVMDRATVVELIDNDQNLLYLDNKGKNLNRIGINGAQKQILVQSAVKINDISMSSDGKRMAGVRADGRLIIWDPSGAEIKTMDISDLELTSIEFSSDGKYLGVGEEKGKVTLYNASNYSFIASYTDHVGIISDIDFNHKNEKGLSTFMATSSYDNTTRIWNLNGLTDPPITYISSQYQFSVAFFPDNTLLFSGSARGILKAYSTQAEPMADLLCGYINRNMTELEWLAYIGEDIPQEDTCPVVSSSSRND